MSDRNPPNHSRKTLTDMDSGIQLHADDTSAVDDGKVKTRHKVDDATARANTLANEAAGKISGVGYDGLQRADEIANKASSKASKVGYDGLAHADEKANEAAASASKVAYESLDRANQFADKAQHQADDSIHKAGDALESAGSYLRNTDTTELIGWVEQHIRQNPIRSVLIAAGLGYLLARIWRD